ncbi:hypothetical protein GCM10018953_45710 [Streptosporangium nondiastaticum]
MGSNSGTGAGQKERTVPLPAGNGVSARVDFAKPVVHRVRIGMLDGAAHKSHHPAREGPRHAPSPDSRAKGNSTSSRTTSPLAVRRQRSRSPRPVMGDS